MSVNDSIFIGTPPAWARASIDEETLVNVTRELVWLFDKIQIDDSRSWEWVCRETALIFQKKHASDDPKYWHNGRQFLDELLDVTESVMRILELNPGWINDQHWSMHGTDVLWNKLRCKILP